MISTGLGYVELFCYKQYSNVNGICIVECAIIEIYLN